MCSNQRCSKYSITDIAFCEKCRKESENEARYQLIICKICGREMVLRTRLMTDSIGGEVGICTECNIELKKREKENVEEQKTSKINSEDIINKLW